MSDKKDLQEQEKEKKPDVKQKKIIKKESKPETKTSKIMAVLKTEYPFEGVLLGVLGILVLLLGVYIFEAQVLEIRFTDFWLFATDTRIKIFSSVVMVIGLSALFLAFNPFLMPGVREMQRVSWPTKNTMLNHSARVFGFIIFLSFMFVLYDMALRPVFAWITGTGG